MGTQPLVVIRVAWPTGALYYADRNYDLAGIPCDGKILELGSIASIRKSVSSGEASSVSITLDDSDGSIKSIIDRFAIEAVEVEIYHHYSGLTQGDLTLLLSGYISNGYNWSEGQRQITINVDVVPKGDTDVGFAPTGEDVPNLARDAVGQAWPLCFGTVLMQKAARPYSFNWGKLLNIVTQDSTTALISNGSEYEQGVEQTVVFAAPGLYMVHKGTFNGNLFTFTEKNAAVATNIQIVARDDADSDRTNPAVLWIAPNSYPIAGMYCFIDHLGTKMVNYCTHQIGNKCFFSKGWKVNNELLERVLPGYDIDTIDEIAAYPREAWGVNYTYERFEYGQYTQTGEVTGDYTIVPGANIGRKTTIPEHNLRIANLVPSTEILGVYAYRTYQNVRGLWQVPTRYYTKSLSQTVAGKQCTTITLKPPIATKMHGWEDDIYVSLRSSLSNNTADVLKYIIEQYSDYDVDEDSYTELRTRLWNYPSNFVINRVSQAIPLCEEIAYQARSAIIVSNGKVYFKYLSYVPTAIATIDADRVEVNSLTLGASQETITRFNANWRRDGVQENDTKYVIKTNIDEYGEHEDSKDFYIYNIESLVQLSAHFWSWRAANSWRQLSFNGFLTDLNVEAFDTCLINLPIVSANSIKALVTNTSLDTKENAISFSMELASLANDKDSDNQPQQSASYYSGDPNHPVTNTEEMPVDPGLGLSEIDYQPPTEQDNQPEQQPGTSVQLAFHDLPETLIHDTEFTFSVRTEYEDGSVAAINNTVDLTFNFSVSGYTPSVTQVNIVDGIGTVTMLIEGSADDGTFTVSGLGQGTAYYGISDRVTILGVIPVTYVEVPAFVQRDNEYTLTFTGEPSTVYSVSVQTEDPDDHYVSNNVPLTEASTNADGDGEIVFRISGGTTAIDNTNLILSYDGRQYKSPSISVVDIDSSINVVLTTEAGALASGDVVMNTGSTWAKADTTAGKTLGVVGKVAGGLAYIVVRGLICIPALTPHIDYYCITGGVLTTSSLGRYVLRSYAGGLAWVGGGSAIAKLTDIGDVGDLPTIDKSVIYFDTTAQQWLTGAFTTTDQSLQITDWFDFKIRDKGVTYAKLQDIDGCSVIGKHFPTAGTPTAINASANGHVLMRRGDELYFDTLIDENIAAGANIAWSKVSKTGASILHIPDAASYIAAQIAAAGGGSASITIGMTASQGIAHSDNTTADKTGTTFTLGFYPFTEKGQMLYCDGLNPVNSQFTIKNLFFPAANARNALLVADDSTGVPTWKKAVTLGTSGSGGGSLMVYHAVSKYIELAAGYLKAYESASNYVELNAASQFLLVQSSASQYIVANSATSLLTVQYNSNYKSVLSGQGTLTNTRNGTVFNGCDVNTITSSTSAPSAAGVKGQMHFIY